MFEETDPQPITRPSPPRARPASDPLSEISRGLPYSDDAEKGIISCFLQNPVDLLPDAAESMTGDAFYHSANRQIYEELQLFAGTGRALDLVTFSQFLIDKGVMERIGGPGFLAELLSFVPTPAHFPYYKKILRDKWILRRAIGTCTEGIQSCYEHQEDIEKLLDKIETGALAIRPPDNGIGDDSFKEGLHRTFDAIQLQMQNTGELAGISTGLPWFDEMTSGLLPGLYVIAARPSMAKTALSLNIFEHITFNLGLPAGFFSLEMSRDRLIRRLIAMQGWIPLSALLKGKLDAELQTKFLRTYNALQRKVNAFIDDRSALTISQVKSKARRWKKQHGIVAIFLDYLQRMGTSSRAKSLRDIHAENSTGLADMAKELELPVIVLAQLNRDCETEKRRPRMSDVEGCGRIEQDGDVIGLLSRHKKQPDNQHNRHLIVDIDKNRDGPTGSEVHLFQGPFMRFRPDPVSPDDLK